MLSAALMGVLMLVLAEALRLTQHTLRDTSGASDANSEIQIISSQISRDLVAGKLAEVRAQTGPTSLVAPDGSALWMLSNMNPITNLPVIRSDGTAFWQRNVLYYAVIPNNHNGLYGYNCSGGAGPNGHDDRCPHKLLLRKVIDQSPATDAVNENNMETIIDPGINPYLTRPVGYNTSAMLGTETGLQEVTIAGRRILGFRAEVVGNAVDVELSVVSLRRAQAKVAIGTTSLYNTVYTYRAQMSYRPESI